MLSIFSEWPLLDPDFDDWHSPPISLASDLAAVTPGTYATALMKMRRKYQEKNKALPGCAGPTPATGTPIS